MYCFILFSTFSASAESRRAYYPSCLARRALGRAARSWEEFDYSSRFSSRLRSERVTGEANIQGNWPNLDGSGCKRPHERPLSVQDEHERYRMRCELGMERDSTTCRRRLERVISLASEYHPLKTHGTCRKGLAIRRVHASRSCSGTTRVVLWSSDRPTRQYHAEQGGREEGAGRQRRRPEYRCNSRRPTAEEMKTLLFFLIKKKGKKN